MIGDRMDTDVRLRARGGPRDDPGAHRRSTRGRGRAIPVPAVARRRLDRRPGRRARLSSGVEREQALGASSSSARRVAASNRRPNGSRSIRPRSWRHVPATAPSTRNDGNECGVLSWNSAAGAPPAACRVRRACTSSVASHVGRNRTGAGVSGSGAARPAGRAAPRRPRRGSAELERAPAPRLSAAAQPGEARDVLARRRARSPEIAAHEQLHAASHGRSGGPTQSSASA